MRRIIVMVILGLLPQLLLAQTTQAVAKPSSMLLLALQTKSLPQAITILRQAYHHVAQGILIESLPHHKIYYQKNADRYFIPASNLKLFTAAAALWFLKADFRFRTQMLTVVVKPEKSAILNGNLYVKFVGDPGLTGHDLQTMVQSLSQQGIKRINGAVVLDSSTFDDDAYPQGAMWEDENTCFAAPINAVILDKNCFTAFVLVKSAVKNSHVTPVYIKEKNPYVHISATVRTIAKNSDLCPLELRSDEKNNYYLSGCIARRTKKQVLDVAIRNPKLYAMQYIKKLLQQHKIIVRDGVKLGVAPTNLKVIAEHVSPPLVDIITTMLKESNNLIANVLFKTMGQHYFHEQGNWYNSALALRNILKKQAHLELTKRQIYDGAGMSRYNLITPRQISLLLQAVYADATIKTDFLKSLPIGGVDGTLATRLQQPQLKSHVFAKTGTMQAVSTLSGYLVTKQKRWFIFSIMNNNFLTQPKKMHDFEENICQVVIERY